MPQLYNADYLRAVASGMETGEVWLETLQVSHTAVAADIFLVNDRTALTATLEAPAGQTGASATFLPLSFDYSLFTQDERSLLQSRVRIDNVSNSVMQFLTAVRKARSTDPVKVTYRVYLTSDLTRPAYGPATLLASAPSVGEAVAQVRLVFRDFGRRRFPRRRQTLADLPMLASTR